jgi:hypothetical protein
MMALPFISGFNKITRDDKQICTTWSGNLNAKRAKKNAA